MSYTYVNKMYKGKDPQRNFDLNSALPYLRYGVLRFCPLGLCTKIIYSTPTFIYKKTEHRHFLFIDNKYINTKKYFACIISIH